jgi:hypothetical protein
VVTETFAGLKAELKLALLLDLNFALKYSYAPFEHRNRELTNETVATKILEAGMKVHMGELACTIAGLIENL